MMTKQKEDKIMYPGLGYRFLAKLIDYVIMGGVYYLIITLSAWKISDVLYSSQPHTISSDAPDAFVSYLDALGILSMVMILIILPLYDAIFHSSKWQATLGKRIMGIRVTDLSFQRISFVRSLIRSCGFYMLCCMTGVIAFLIWVFIEMNTNQLHTSPNPRLFGFLILGDILFLLFIFALSAIQKRKQMLHDICAKTLVVKKNEILQNPVMGKVR
jgi:uncharacterized RDD family membrane protein YckC